MEDSNYPWNETKHAVAQHNWVIETHSDVSNAHHGLSWRRGSGGIRWGSASKRGSVLSSMTTSVSPPRHGSAAGQAGTTIASATFHITNKLSEVDPQAANRRDDGSSSPAAPMQSILSTRARGSAAT
jgi:hypothetical protein